VARHIKIFHENKRELCAICRITVQNLAQHNRRKHAAETRIECKLCRTAVDSKKRMRDHLQQNHGHICVPSNVPQNRICPGKIASQLFLALLWIRSTFVRLRLQRLKNIASSVAPQVLCISACILRCIFLARLKVFVNAYFRCLTIFRLRKNVETPSAPHH
jgi:hypothetical protein